MLVSTIAPKHSSPSNMTAMDEIDVQGFIPESLIETETKVSTT